MKGSSLILALLCLLTAVAASAASRDRILHSFGPAPDGRPQSGVIADSAGNLYGTAYGSGKNCPSCGGEVFQLRPVAPGGGYDYKVLHQFQPRTADGAYPQGILTMDSKGNLYGTTVFGGTVSEANCPSGCGTVFELSPTASGPWAETILYSFQGGSDGKAPNTGVIFDKSGNLYGVTEGGGSITPLGLGTVFELVPTGGGWSETILHAFLYSSGDGNYPWGLNFDSAGNLWGVTPLGGSVGCGTVYELTAGSWAENIIYDFQCGTDGYQTVSRLVFDSAGNVYGTAWLDGAYGHGMVFEMTKPVSGNWTEQILYNFTGTPDGANPFSGLTWDTMGNLYGTTEGGGASGWGTIFKLSPNSGGGWTESVVYSFKPTNMDGRLPIGNVIFGPGANLYGTTDEGGSSGTGAVYEVTP